VASHFGRYRLHRGRSPLHVSYTGQVGATTMCDEIAAAAEGRAALHHQKEPEREYTAEASELRRVPGGR